MNPPTITGRTRARFKSPTNKPLFCSANVTIADVDAYGLQVQAVTVSFLGPPEAFLSQLGGFVQTAPEFIPMTRYSICGYDLFARTDL